MKCKCILSYISGIKILNYAKRLIIFTTSPIPIYSLEPFSICKSLLIMNVCDFPVFNDREKVVIIRRNKTKNPYECTY